MSTKPGKVYSVNCKMEEIPDLPEREISKLLNELWHGGILITKDGVWEVHVEPWEAVCLEHAVKPDTEGADAEEIDRITEEEGWEGYVYLEPSVTGVAFGVSIHYRRIDDVNLTTNRRKREIHN